MGGATSHECIYASYHTGCRKSSVCQSCLLTVLLKPIGCHCIKLFYFLKGQLFSTLLCHWTPSDLVANGSCHTCHQKSQSLTENECPLVVLTLRCCTCECRIRHAVKIKSKKIIKKIIEGVWPNLIRLIII